MDLDEAFDAIRPAIRERFARGADFRAGDAHFATIPDDALLVLQEEGIVRRSLDDTGWSLTLKGRMVAKMTVRP